MIFEILFVLAKRSIQLPNYEIISLKGHNGNANFSKNGFGQLRSDTNLKLCSGVSYGNSV